MQSGTTTSSTITAGAEAPAANSTIHARPRSATLARYRNPRPATAPAGLTGRQAAEIQRILARHGRTTWRRRADGSLVVCVLGDRPAACDAPLWLVMRADGTIALAVRPAGPVRGGA